jgi:phytoene synthase
LTRAHAVTTHPTLALIRLHWWREVVQGARRRHPIATPLSDAIAQGLCRPDELTAIIDAREIEAAEGMPTLAVWRDWLLASAGGLAVAAARLLGASDPEPFRPAGAAHGAAGVLRASASLAQRGRCLLPWDVLAEHGLSPEAFAADPAGPAARAALARLAREGLSLLQPAPAGRATIAAALPGVLARRDLRRWPRIDHPRRFGDRFSVTWRGLTGRP